MQSLCVDVGVRMKYYIPDLLKCVFLVSEAVVMKLIILL